MIRLYDNNLKRYADIIGTFKSKYLVNYLIKYDSYPTLCDRSYSRRELRKFFSDHDMKPKQVYHNVHFIFESEIGTRYMTIGDR